MYHPIRKYWSFITSLPSSCWIVAPALWRLFIIYFFGPARFSFVTWPIMHHYPF